MRVSRNRVFRVWFVLSVLALLLAACGGDDDSDSGDQAVESGPAQGTLTVLAARVEWRAGAESAWSEVAEVQSVAQGDTMQTDASGSALLTFYTGTEVEILPGSEIEVTEFVTNADNVQSITLTQLGGETLHRVELVADAESRYVIDTPVAHIVVRGTTFGVQVAADGATRVEVQEGTVRAEIADQVYDIPAGQALDVTAQRETEGPLPLAPVEGPQPTPSLDAILPPDEGK
jgi:hypothetical protein